MRIIFAGTPAFAERVLAAIFQAQHEVALVVTQPDRPAGRGLRPGAGAVKKLALALGLDIFQPASLKEDAAVERLSTVRPDALVTAAYGVLLPPGVLAIAPYGALNVHASLLPRWRGAAPIQRALLAGDRTTGITVIKMDSGLDTGPVLARRALAIGAEDDAQTLHDKLAALGAALVVGVLAELATAGARLEPQSTAGVTYAARIRGSEAWLDWSKPAVELERAVRAFRPSPGAQSALRGELLKIWHARRVAGRGVPGVVLGAGPDGIRIACGRDALEITELQRAGARRLPAGEFLRGFVVTPGDALAIPR